MRKVLGLQTNLLWGFPPLILHVIREKWNITMFSSLNSTSHEWIYIYIYTYIIIYFIWKFHACVYMCYMILRGKTFLCLSCATSRYFYVFILFCQCIAVDDFPADDPILKFAISTTEFQKQVYFHHWNLVQKMDGSLHSTHVW